MRARRWSHALVASCRQGRAVSPFLPQFPKPRFCSKDLRSRSLKQEYAISCPFVKNQHLIAMDPQLYTGFCFMLYNTLRLHCHRKEDSSLKWGMRAPQSILPTIEQRQTWYQTPNKYLRRWVIYMHVYIYTKSISTKTSVLFFDSMNRKHTEGLIRSSHGKGDGEPTCCCIYISQF